MYVYTVTTHRQIPKNDSQLKHMKLLLLLDSSLSKIHVANRHKYTYFVYCCVHCAFDVTNVNTQLIRDIKTTTTTNKYNFFG